MPANTAPISPIAPNTGFNAAGLTTAETSLTALTNFGDVLTAGLNGARVNRLRVCHLGTNVATAMRFFINNGAAPGTAANNALIAEETIAANTLSQAAKAVFYDIYINAVLKPGYKILYTIGTAVATGHKVTAIDAGDY